MEEYGDLAGLHRAEGDVGEELCGGRGGEVEPGLVEVSVLLAEHAGVEVLEELVEAKLADPLGGVAEGRGGPAEGQAPDALLGHRQLEAVAEVLVLGLVSLEPALDEVERRDGRVGDAAGQGSTHGAQREVLGAAELAAVLFRGGGSHHPDDGSFQEKDKTNKFQKIG